MKILRIRLSPKLNGLATHIAISHLVRSQKQKQSRSSKHFECRIVVQNVISHDFVNNINWVGETKSENKDTNRTLTCSSRDGLLSSHAQSNRLWAYLELNPNTVSLRRMQGWSVVAVALLTYRSCDIHDQRPFAVDLIAATWLIYARVGASFHMH